jgi:threonine-phosphate decarboxylase
MQLSDAPAPHGGNIYEMAQTLGLKAGDLLDFSANINPLGYPPGLPGAVAAAWEDLKNYPDRLCRELREALAGFHKLSPQEILVGNGSTELIYLVVRALRPRRVLIVTPAFSEYEGACRMYQVPTAFHAASEADAFTLRAAPDPQEADLVFLANPASPSGALLEPRQLLPILESMAASGAYIVLDEAFIDFVEEASLKNHLGRFPRLIILRSFTKFYGIPGIRLGYALAAPEVMEILAPAQEPWAVNTLAQVMGLACLQDEEFMSQSRAQVDQEREYLREELSHMKGLKLFPGRVNYLLVKLTAPGWSAAQLRQRLLAHKILIRDAGNFRGLDGRFFRVAVRLRPENARLLHGLQVCLRGG